MVGVIVLVVDLVMDVVVIIEVTIVLGIHIEDRILGVRLAIAAKHSDQSLGDLVDRHVPIAHRFDLDMGPPRHS